MYYSSMTLFARREWMHPMGVMHWTTLDCIGSTHETVPFGVASPNPQEVRFMYCILKEGAPRIPTSTHCRSSETANS